MDFKVQKMNADLKEFVVSYIRVVVMSMMPLAITAFLTIPYILGGHPGEVMSGPDLISVQMNG
jgi:hypothetical protein